MPTDFLIARFPVEKGMAIRAIIAKHRHIFNGIRWEQEGPLHLGKFTGRLARPDSDDEGSQTRFEYDTEEIKLKMKKEGASVE